MPRHTLWPNGVDKRFSQGYRPASRANRQANDKGRRLPHHPPFHFLVSTTRSAGAIKDTLGGATYSYYFVAEALRPILDKLGTWSLIDRPESRLSWAAREAKANGKTPIHLAINPLQDVYIASDVPNLVYPFWEFPRIPDRDFGKDTRQNWTRTARNAHLILTACQFTANAFRAAGITTPITLAPLPVPTWTQHLPRWRPEYQLRLTCRWIELDANSIIQRATPEPVQPIETTPRGILYRTLRAAYHKSAPVLGNRWTNRLGGIRQSFRDKSVPQAMLCAARSAYKSTFKSFMNEETQRAISLQKEELLLRLGVPGTTLDPEIPQSTLEIGGLVYTTFISFGDPRKNPGDLLSAFLYAFRDRSDATLVIKLATNRRTAFNETEKLKALYASMGVKHLCRIAVIADFLDDDQIAALMRATTYYVNTSHAEGACMPLQQALAAGRPAIAPAHSAMSEYINPSLAFVIGSDEEPCAWPHDPELRLETTRHRLRWSDLRNGFLESAHIANHATHAYHEMSDAAQDFVQSMCGEQRTTERIHHALTSVLNSRHAA